MTWTWPPASAPAPAPICPACGEGRLIFRERRRYPIDPFNPEQAHLVAVEIWGRCPWCAGSAAKRIEVDRGWICP